MSNKINFTKSAIEALPLPEPGKRVDYWDTKAPGLCVRVSGGGVKAFCVLRRACGRLERVSLGRFPAITVEQARQKAAEINAVIATGGNPNDRRRKDRAEAAFAEFWQEYMDKYSRTRKKPRTVEEDEKTYRNYFAPIAGLKLSKITKQDCQRLHHDIAGRTSGATANRAIAVLSSALGVACDWGYLAENPAKAVKKFKEVARDRFVQGDELPRFWQALLDEQNADWPDVFMVALLTGQRRSDILSMQWAHISLARREWRIPDPKNGEPLTVPLVGAVVELLDARHRSSKGSPFVFPGNGKSGHLTEPKAAWARMMKRAGIEGLHIHDLRRTLGSSMAEQGVNTITTARAMGHKTLAMALRYQHLNMEPRRAAIETGAGAILASAGAREAADVISFDKMRKHG